jgi:hypothetical protein
MAGRKTSLAMAAASLLAAHAGQAQEDEAPDLNFLEYLGSWQETDEEWEIVAELEDEDMQDTDKKRKRESEEND